MAYKIASIGWNFCEEDVDHFGVDQHSAVAHYDIIVFMPVFPGFYHGEAFSSGERYMSVNSGKTLLSRLNHWRTELSYALKAGKTVVVQLAPPTTYTIDTGQRTYPRAKQTTIHTERLTSYNSLPATPKGFTEAIGTKLRLAPGSDSIAGVWEAVRSRLEAKVFFGGESGAPLILLDDGTGRAVACRSSVQSSLFFVPTFSFSDEAFELDSDGDEVWSAVGEKESAQLLQFVVALHESAKAGGATPKPEWAMAASFRSVQVAKIEQEIEKQSARIAEMERRIEGLNEDLRREQGPLELLFGQGSALECEVRAALSLMGFVVSEFDDGTHQFDVVCEADGYRYIGECEGRDRKAIDVGKLSQLGRCVEEDFAVRATGDYARGILFGNGERLKAPSERGSTFTERVLLGAAQREVRLVATVDLFGASLAIRNGAGADFQKACRDAIHDCKGGLVQFPPIGQWKLKD